MLRLRVLLQHGGLYLDLDMISVRPLTPAMRRASFLIGWQDSGGWGWRAGKAHYGLCNAMMAAVPDAPFVAYLLRTYSSFRSYGRDSTPTHTELEQSPDEQISACAGCSRVLPRVGGADQCSGTSTRCGSSAS